MVLASCVRTSGWKVSRTSPIWTLVVVFDSGTGSASVAGPLFGVPRLSMSMYMSCRGVAGRSVAGIASGPELDELDAGGADLVERAGQQRTADAPVLLIGVDGDHLDFRAVRIVAECHGRESGWPGIDLGHPDRHVLVPAHFLDRAGLPRSPVRVNEPVQARAEHAGHRLKDRLPGPKRERHDRRDVGVELRADDERGGRRSRHRALDGRLR